MEEMLRAFFEDDSWPVLLIYLAASIAVLVKGADWLVDGAVGISERIHVPKVIVGATVVSLGTTTPEAAVSVMAAFKGSPDFALGNSVGSIICDTGMIFGLCCLLTRLPADKFILNRHGWLQFGSGVLLVLMSVLFVSEDGQGHVIPRFIGLFFIVLLVGYLLASVYWARQQHLGARAKVKEIEKKTEQLPGTNSLTKNLILLVVGLCMVLAASETLVTVVKILCERWGVSPAIISATVVAFGTSLPELMTAITSIRKKHTELLVGNIIGADILNVLFVTGASACAAPLKVDPLFYKLHFPVMITVLVLFRLMAYFAKDGKFAQRPGWIFLGLYLLYAVGNYLLGAPGH